MTAIEELARRAGIVESFVDARKQRRAASVHTQQAILEAMGFAGDPESAARELEAWDRHEWQTPLGPVTVHRAPGPPVLMITLAETVQEFEWTVALEDGSARQGRIVADTLETVGTQLIDGQTYVRRRVRLPEALPFGYHTMSVDAGGPSMRLIVAPGACWLPGAMRSRERMWGLTAQLYLLRSRKNWGIGDFGDLRALVDVLRPLGADVLGLNPLHAMFLDAPENASPYSPASRLLLNVLNIDVAALVARLDDANAAALIEEDSFQRRLENWSNIEQGGIRRHRGIEARRITVCVRRSAREPRVRGVAGHR